MADAPPPSLEDPPSNRRWFVAGALALIALLAVVLIVALVRQDGSNRPSSAEWSEAFAVESVVILDARTAIDEAALRSRGAASVRCEAILADPSIDAAIESITDAPDESTEERAAEWAATFREGNELCVAGDLDDAEGRFDRADELLLLLGEGAGVEVDIPGYDRDQEFENLTSVEFGLTAEQANCVLDEVEAQDLEDVLVEADAGEVDDADIEAVTDIFGRCTLGDLFTEELDDAIDETVDEERDSETG